MKYVFGMALIILSYAIVGATHSWHDLANTAAPQQMKPTPAVGTNPNSFHIIRVVEQKNAGEPTTRIEPNQQSLIHDIQEGLKAAGCNIGVIDGSWNDRTHQAMDLFVREAHAELSAQDPSSALLALIHSRSGEQALCKGILPALETEPLRPLPTPSITAVDRSSALRLYRPLRTAESSFRHPLGTF